jgi:hypothetical protein
MASQAERAKELLEEMYLDDLDGIIQVVGVHFIHQLFRAFRLTSP